MTITLQRDVYALRYLKPRMAFEIPFEPGAPGRAEVKLNRYTGHVGAILNSGGAPSPGDPFVHDPSADLEYPAPPLDEGPPSLDPGTPTGDPTIRVELFPPRATAPIASREVSIGQGTIPALRQSLAWYFPATREEPWRLRITNISLTHDQRCRVHLTFPWVERTIRQADLSRGFLDRIARTALAILRPELIAGSGSITVGFSEEIRVLSGGRVNSVRKDLPTGVGIDSLEMVEGLAIRFEAHPQDGVPRILLGAGAHIRWHIGGADPANKEMTHVVVASVTMSLPTAGPPGARMLYPTFEVDVTISPEADWGLTDYALPVVSLAAGGIHLAIAGEVEEAFEEALRDALAGAASDIGRYLTEAFHQLASRADVFYNLKAIPAGTTTPRAYRVEYYAPPPEHPATLSGSNIPSPGLPSEPPPLPLTATDRRGLDALHQRVDHIVVLMMENRSFDQMLGYLSLKGRSDVDGLSGREYNDVVLVTPYEHPAMLYSPNHSHASIMRQIAQGKMTGFLDEFIARYPGVDPALVMGYYDETMLPIYDLLAREYVVCDRWFAAHPGPTFPNRFATLCGSVPELENFHLDDRRIGYVFAKTLFDVLDRENVDWRYYEHDVAFLRMFDRYRIDTERVRPVQDFFAAAARRGGLPKVSFVDPSYVDFPPGWDANDDHPPASVTPGQRLVSCIYQRLRQSPDWNKILLVITYDEHGGFFDHVAPPGTAEAPETIERLHKDGPTHLGCRVPAFLVSPWVPRGQCSHHLYDHTSIAKTILLRFCPDRYASLGRRVERARHFGPELSNSAPRTDMPRIPNGWECPSVAARVNRAFEVVPYQARSAMERDDYHAVIQTFAQPRPLG